MRVFILIFIEKVILGSNPHSHILKLWIQASAYLTTWLINWLVSLHLGYLRSTHSHHASHSHTVWVSTIIITLVIIATNKRLYFGGVSFPYSSHSSHILFKYRLIIFIQIFSHHLVLYRKLRRSCIKIILNRLRLWYRLLLGYQFRLRRLR